MTINQTNTRKKLADEQIERIVNGLTYEEQEGLLHILQELNDLSPEERWPVFDAMPDIAAKAKTDGYNPIEQVLCMIAKIKAAKNS